MNASNAPQDCFATPSSSGWAVVTVLLLRKDLAPADQLAFFRTCKTAAELVPCLASSPLRLAINKAQGRHSPYTAELLASLAACAPTDSKTAGTDIHLTVCGESQHSLPKDIITVVTLQDAAFTPKQWREFRDSLPQYPRLRSVRLRGRNWAVPPEAAEAARDPEAYLDAVFSRATNPDAEAKSEQTTPATATPPVYIPEFELMDDPETINFVRKLGLRCTSMTTQVTSCYMLGLACWGTTDTSTEEINMVVDKVGSLHMALAPFSIAASAKRVTITFPSLDCIPEDAISNKYFKQPPAWESLTFAGIVRYGFVGTLPLKPSTPVTIKGHLYTEADLDYSECDKALSTLSNLRFVPVPNTSPALRAAGKGQCPTLHLYLPEIGTLLLVSGRLSTDVQCLTLHVPGECALFDMKDLMTLGSKLPAHVTMVRFRLDSTHGTADIMKDAPRAVDNVPGELRPAHLALRNALRHAAQMMSSGVLAKLPAHVTVVCVEVVNNWAAGEERIAQWQRLLQQLAGFKSKQAKSTELILANVLPGAGHGHVADPAPETLVPWLPEEETSLHKWCKDKSWANNTVTLRLV